MYFAHLDSVRWYAVAMVVFAHIFQIWTWDPTTSALFPLGKIGVIIFFVLSGFLITRLLLKEPQDKSMRLSFKEFYIRRSLRIFPIYYLYLGICYFYNIAEAQDIGLSPWLYIANLHVFAQNAWLGTHSHVWTLSVEEQFYLIWPFLILFLRGKNKILFNLFIATILTSIIIRIILLTNGFSGTQTTVFSLTNIDFFALGALIALAHIQGKDLKKSGYPAIISGVLVYYGSYYLFDKNTFIAFGQFALGLAASGVIILALHSKMKPNIFHNKATIYLGRISYGIYLYHNVIVRYYSEIANFFGIEVGPSIYIKIILSLIFTIGFSSLSYFIIEKPILRLKNRFRTS